MYKLLIFIVFPFFAFSNDPTFNLQSVCSSSGQDSVTQKLADLSCKEFSFLPDLGWRTTYSKRKICDFTLKENQKALIEQGWTQKQLNFIGFFVTKGISGPDAERITYTRYITREGKSRPSSRRELMSLINEIREEFGSEEERSVSTVTPGCENIFSPSNVASTSESVTETEEPASTSEPVTEAEEPASTSSESVTEAEAPCIDCRRSKNTLPILRRFFDGHERGEIIASPVRDLSSVCSSPDQEIINIESESIEYKLRNHSCRHFDSGSHSDCMVGFLKDSISLLARGWTQKQLNYIVWHAHLQKRSNELMTPLKFLQGIPIPSNNEEVLGHINRIRNFHEMESLKDISTQTPGCENLFPSTAS